MAMKIFTGLPLMLVPTGLALSARFSVHWTSYETFRANHVLCELDHENKLKTLCNRFIIVVSDAFTNIS